MSFDIRAIINAITCGLILLIFGLKENKEWKIVFGSAFTAAGIILNTISTFSGG